MQSLLTDWLAFSFIKLERSCTPVIPSMVTEQLTRSGFFDV